jgi:hypothetical protein
MSNDQALSMDDLEAMMGSLDTPTITPAPVAPEPAKTAQPTANGLKVFVDVAQLKKDLQVNPNDLDDAVISQAPMFVHYAEQAAWARRQWEKSKLATEVLESQVDSAWRKKFVEDGVKTTETMVMNAVKADPRIIAAKTQAIEARALYDIANDAREAYMQRKDMIVQISVDRRRERDGQLRILAAKDTENAVATGRKDALAAEAARRAALAA